MMTSQTVVVIGGGVAGLAAARALHHRGLRVKVLEQKASLGGRVGTSSIKGISINNGARLFYSFSPSFNALLDELGLADQMVRHRQLSAHCAGLGESWIIDLMPSAKGSNADG